jgi:hypothetical protein
LGTLAIHRDSLDAVNLGLANTHLHAKVVIGRTDTIDRPRMSALKAEGRDDAACHQSRGSSEASDELHEGCRSPISCVQSSSE